ncbi:hypothetical protein Ddye_004549 [Dipteronia dyeriana]|uniref:CASP-like protein n=1 Tax=Dipteronia dyeriana TaxID=168575 RepID=A0AAD9XV82_9ROSI|nr:hypothetical protein Ddye_004549 [Dipteronia dyeriana]
MYSTLLFFTKRPFAAKLTDDFIAAYLRLGRKIGSKPVETLLFASVLPGVACVVASVCPEGFFNSGCNLYHATSTQSISLFGYNLVVHYSDTSAMRYLFGTDIVACVCSVLSLICVFLLSRSGSYLKHSFYLLLHDMVIMVLLMSVCAAAIAIAYGLALQFPFFTIPSRNGSSTRPGQVPGLTRAGNPGLNPDSFYPAPGTRAGCVPVRVQHQRCARPVETLVEMSSSLPNMDFDSNNPLNTQSQAPSYDINLVA